MVTSPETNQTTGARLGWLANVKVAPLETTTLEYLNTTAHLFES